MKKISFYKTRTKKKRKIFTIKTITKKKGYNTKIK